MKEAIAIIDELKDKRNASNFKDTLGYIYLQRGAIADAVKDLEEAGSSSDDPEIMFRYTIALNAAGRAKEALEKLINSVSIEKGNYAPSHELHLLKDYINGEFKTKLSQLLDQRLIPGVLDPPPCSPDGQKS